MLDGERFQKFYKEVEFFLNNASAEDDCSIEENEIYCELANLKNAIENYQDSKKKNPIKSTDTCIVDHSFGYYRDIWKGSGIEVR